MRHRDLAKIIKLLATLEAGEKPTEKELKEAREVVNREREILSKRATQQDINLGKYRI